jgi:hypothetical protein
MDPTNSLFEIKLIATLLHDVSDAHGLVFNTRALKQTLKKVEDRARDEGIGFLTKTLPRLGKAFDKALAGERPLSATELGFDSLPGGELPRFLGEFFSRVLQPNGTLLSQPCADSVKVVRQVCTCYYKYKLPYTDEQEHQVVQKFEKTEDDLEQTQTFLLGLEAQLRCEANARFSYVTEGLGHIYSDRGSSHKTNLTSIEVVREARNLLNSLFSWPRKFDPKDIIPRHGPGAVATKQKLWEKFQWTNISAKITEWYPIDAYYMASAGHVCDTYRDLGRIGEASHSARVILVPKDSRGPRLISCEPVDFQWIQQGLGRAIVEHVERHRLTRDNVRFTDQEPNRMAALYGSLSGKYVTLDLNEASDRVSTDLVRLLFPEWLFSYLDACRTSSTLLPDGREINLRKFAPMGSCLCFPILSLVVWSLLTAGVVDADTRESIYVYGDDVIVPKAYASDAIERLESFGLKVNRDKSCTSGLFRESCGMDAFKGTNVTPVRLRTVWSWSRSPDVYASWIAYANQFYDRRYFRTYDFIVSRLVSIYGPIPGEELNLSAPSLRQVTYDAKPIKRRWNKNLQKFEYHVLAPRSPSIHKELDGWSMLLRWFTEKARWSFLDSVEPLVVAPDGLHRSEWWFDNIVDSVSDVSEYTSRLSSMLERRWR